MLNEYCQFYAKKVGVLVTFSGWIVLYKYINEFVITQQTYDLLLLIKKSRPWTGRIGVSRCNEAIVAQF